MKDTCLPLSRDALATDGTIQHQLAIYIHYSTSHVIDSDHSTLTDFNLLVVNILSFLLMNEFTLILRCNDGRKT